MNQGSFALYARLPSDAADIPALSGLQENGSRNSLAHRKGKVYFVGSLFKIPI